MSQPKRSKRTSTGTRQSKDSPSSSFPIVGVEVSMTSLDSLKKLLRALPARTGTAVIVAPNPDLARIDLIDALKDLKRNDLTPVNGPTPVEPNNVYLLPPAVETILEGDQAVPQSRVPESAFTNPINRFLRSLASVRAKSAIGIGLTPEISDGSRGLETIRALGGITFFCDAGGESPPSGPFDFALKPEGIIKELGNLSRHPYVSDKDANLLPSYEEIQQVIGVLNRAAGGDYSHYDDEKLRRRASRRMAIRGLTKSREYIALLQNKLSEVDALIEDLSTASGDFFDDSGVFQLLAEEVFPALLKQTADGDALRIWVPNCGSAESAYSIAIAAVEACGGEPSKSAVQVFATETSLPVIRKARAGLYPSHIEADIPRALLAKYFVEVESGYQVSPALRECCVFAKHDLIQDTPFSKLDLIYAPHVLIYNELSIRQKIIPNFHFALKPEGYLLLGASPRNPAFETLFKPVNETKGLFAKKAAEGSGSVMGRLIDLDAENLAEAATHDTERLDMLSSNIELQSINEELENTKRELQKSWTFSEAVINTIRDPLVILDGNFRVVKANRSFFQTFQILPTQSVQAVFFDLADGVWNIASFKALLNALIAANVHFQDFEVTREFPSVGRRSLLLNASLIDAKPLSGTGPLILLSMKDITNRKIVEEQMKETNAELLRLNEIRASFSNMVYHEFRTPLSSIAESIALVLEGVEGELKPAQAQMLEITKRNVDRLSNLTNNVLNWTRVELGKMKMVFERANVNALVREAVQIMRPMMGKKSIDVTVDLASPDIVAVCDADKMKQVVINLLDNGIKHVSGGGKLAVRLSLNGNEIRIEVKDSGTGIAPADQKKIFQLFGKIPSEPRLMQRGFGVGLAICKYIVEKHGGEISVESEPGQGSLFTVVFPNNLSA